MSGQWLDSLSLHKKAVQLVEETDEKASRANWGIYAKLRGKVKANSVPCASLMCNCFWKLCYQRECIRAQLQGDVKWIRMSVCKVAPLVLTMVFTWIFIWVFCTVSILPWITIYAWLLKSGFGDGRCLSVAFTIFQIWLLRWIKLAVIYTIVDIITSGTWSLQFKVHCEIIMSFVSPLKFFHWDIQLYQSVYYVLNKPSFFIDFGKCVKCVAHLHLKKMNIVERFIFFL